jgi:hypothetical protein
VSKKLLYKVAYDEAVRALSEQQAVIDSFCAWLALADFLAVVGVCLSTLWTYRWEFTADPHEMVDLYVETSSPAAIEDLYRRFALDMHDSYLRNRRGLELLAILFQIATVLLALEIVLWTVAIASTP